MRNPPCPFPWSLSVGAAREVAQAGNMLVLACVRATTRQNQLLRAAPPGRRPGGPGCAGPDPSTVRSRAGPATSALDYSPAESTWVETFPLVPLRELGTTLKDTKAPGAGRGDGRRQSGRPRYEHRRSSTATCFFATSFESLTKANVGQGDEKDSWKLLARGELDAADKAFGGDGEPRGAIRPGPCRITPQRSPSAFGPVPTARPGRRSVPARGDGTSGARAGPTGAGFAEAEPILREAAGSDGTRSGRGRLPARLRARPRRLSHQGHRGRAASSPRSTHTRRTPCAGRPANVQRKRSRPTRS